MENPTFIRKKLQTGILAFMLFSVAPVFSQAEKQGKFIVGNFSTIQSKWLAAGRNLTTTLQVDHDSRYTIQFNVKEVEPNGDFKFYGDVKECKDADFYIDRINGVFQGALINYDTKKAYTLQLDESGNLVSEETNIHNLVCIDYTSAQITPRAEEQAVPGITYAIPQVESYPGAKAVLYLDFDGEVVSGSRWESGKTIDAKPMSTMTDSKITQVWEKISEDYWPWNINVTTIRSKYDAAPKDSRMMVIFTSTNFRGQGVGGSAYLGSFDDGRNDPCWVFWEATQSASTAGSHEAGHTFGMNHDGTTSIGYYGGNNLWGPIMGNPLNEEVVHWSNGGYPNANNKENDVNIIDGNINVALKADPHGDNISNATNIVHTNGKFNDADNQGVIITRTDKDVFTFNTTGGNATINARPPAINWPNLNIGLRLLDANGNEVAAGNRDDAIKNTTTISKNLAAGKYYIEIDGVGLTRGWTGSPHGYDDYGCLGRFYLSGQFVSEISTGINDQQDVSGISIYPNPARDFIQVDFGAALNEKAELSMVNMLGATLYKIPVSEGSLSHRISTVELSPGIYLLRLTSGKNTSTRRLVINHP